MPAPKTGATLANVWPPRLPEDLRRVVQSDLGEHGFSHVQAVKDGAVLLLSADAVVLWRGPEDFTAVPYACVKLRRPRVGKPEVTLQLESDVPPSSATEGPEAEPPPAPCVTYDLDKGLATRVEQLVARHATAARAAVLRAASVRAAVVEIATAPIATAPTHADPPRPAQAEQAQPAADVSWDGIVMSALDPVGYVLHQDRDALVAVQAGSPLGVGARVRVATRIVEGRSRSVVVDEDKAEDSPRQRITHDAAPRQP